ncbi:hypothetical protein AB0F05_35710 [Streptomyces microflavus]|uniref:hypothetical protein n=1 Tax=Streptomyces microflavus TaxID=1919 RepID=UPI0033EB94F4
MNLIDTALTAFTSLQPHLSGFLLHDLPGNIAAQLICTAGALLLTRFKNRNATEPATPQLQTGTTPPAEPDTPHTNHVSDPADHPPCPHTDTPPTN